MLAGLGEVIATAVPGRTIFPAGIEMAGDRVTMHSNAFKGYYAPSGQPNWIELKPADRDDCGGSWQAGDVFVVSVKIVPDAAAKAWYAHNDQVQFLFGAGSDSGTPPNMAQRWAPEGSDQHMIMFGPCPKPGTGFRLFVYPHIGSKGVGPDKDISFTMQAEVRKLPPR